MYHYRPPGVELKPRETRTPRQMRELALARKTARKDGPAAKRPLADS